MIKKIGILMFLGATISAQDKGQFKSYSNPFYGEIVSESKKYEKIYKEIKDIITIFFK